MVAIHSKGIRGSPLLVHQGCIYIAINFLHPWVHVYVHVYHGTKKIYMVRTYSYVREHIHDMHKVITLLEYHCTYILPG